MTTDSDFIPGQRWISDTEPELGLGLIQGIELRTVTVVFPASASTRVYAKEDAPLTRVRFTHHDVIEDCDHVAMSVHEVLDDNGLLTYVGEHDDGTPCTLPEIDINPRMHLNKPRDRLFNAQLDKNNRFVLRYQTLAKLHALAPSPVRGLCGARVSLIPHQFYIAHEVAGRNAPRVLLADEVGLGKTIEAGLILHHQLFTGRAQRVLILVPEPLLHQWLIEMLRRFNLRFSIFDEGRCAALEAEGGNPFHAEQLVLASLEFVQQHPERQPSLQDGHWDLVVVDEAHHLHWQPEQASPEYCMVEALCQRSPGVLLLTATPEQLGAAGHFARLRLLDPDRFYDLEAFLEEETLYEPVAHAVEELLHARRLSDTTVHALELAVGDSPTALALLNQLRSAKDDTAQQREALIRHLCDRHGTGRVLFRNTRSAIKGFPRREPRAFPLAAPEDYLQALKATSGLVAVTPEQAYQESKTAEAADWTRLDPRVQWLYDTLKALKGEKVLVICAHAETVLELETALRSRYGLRVALFHEGMRILERDRAAAYFADMEQGAQTLICSEIGSEGRNFQFAHHLVLFDLPLDPDLLEQRIGRLDRIGQRHPIKILIPYLKATAQDVLYRWYHEGLNAFAQTCPAGQGVFTAVKDELLARTQNPIVDKQDVDALIARTQPIYTAINQRLQQGRDYLLELNSNRKDVAVDVLHHIEQQDQAQALREFMGQAFDVFGVDFEERDANSFVIRPSDHMLVHHFPELPADGVTATFQRDHALAHEDQLYLTWEHPMVTGAMDLILSTEHGNAAVAVTKHPTLKTGEVLLEALYRVEGAAPRQLQIDRYLPPSLLRVVMDDKLEDKSAQLPFEQLPVLPVELDRLTLRQIILAKQDILRNMLSEAERTAALELPLIIKHYTGRMEKQLGEELARLRELKQVNPNVRDEEIAFIEVQIQGLAEHMAQTTLRLDALRLLIAA